MLPSEGARAKDGSLGWKSANSAIQRVPATYQFRGFTKCGYAERHFPESDDFESQRAMEPRD